MLHDYRIGTRLGIGFGAILLAAAASFAAIVFIGEIGGRQVDDANQRMNERVGAVNTMIVAQLEAAVSVRNAAMATNGRSVKQELEIYNKALKTLQTEEAAMVKRGLDAKSKGVLDAAIAMRQQSGPIVEEAMDFVMNLAGEEGTRVLRTKQAPVQAQWAELLKQLAVAEQRAGEEKVAAIKQANLVKTGLLAVVLLCVMGGGVVFAVLLTRSVTKPLANVSDVANRVAQGDLNVEIRIEGKDEMMLRSLHSTSGTDEIATMCRAFAAMVTRLTDGAKIIKKKSNDMAAMLKTMPQGLLTFDANNVVQPEYSAYLADILETQEIAGRSVMELVFAGTTLSSDTLSQVEAIAGACVGEDAMNFTFNRHLLVPEIEKVMPDGRTKVLELTWSAIVNDDDVTEQILLCIRDVTELRQLSQEAAAQKRELEIIGQVLAVPVEKFEAMMASAREHLERTEEIVRESEGQLDAVNEAFKHLHTIKGNARTYALKHLASVVHDAEQVYAELRSGEADVAWDRRELLTDLSELRGELELHEHVSREKLGRKAEGARRAMNVPEGELRALLDKLQRASESQSVDVLRSVVHQAHRVLRMLKAQPMSAVVEDIVKGLGDLAHELGKPVPAVRVDDGGVAFEESAASAMSDAFVHILRNALDHGIEMPDERQAAGKSLAGTIDMVTRAEEGWVTVSVRDDGRGLALQRIRAAAQTRGLVSDAASLEDQAAADLIFAAGFSTAERVTMVSGRGVGMDAVQSAVRALGGDVSIRFEDDRTGADYRQFSMLVKVPASLAVNFNQ